MLLILASGSLYNWSRIAVSVFAERSAFSFSKPLYIHPKAAMKAAIKPNDGVSAAGGMFIAACPTSAPAGVSASPTAIKAPNELLSSATFRQKRRSDEPGSAVSRKYMPPNEMRPARNKR